MSLWTVPKASLLPAAILSGLVIFTYSTLQNYGPESAIRKFHAALHNVYTAQMNGKPIPDQDWDMLRSSLETDIGPKNQIVDGQDLDVSKMVLTQFQAGSTYSLARMDRHPREVRIAVLYSNPHQPTVCIVWVVDKVGRQWKVSAQKTLSAMPGNALR